mmetsp:Transcript_45981/g.41158  ORF Transcript_45981/g.41158 Transcript_45981/m.41158 type:complete len:386 (+) Transcript_45981:203-1360(+)|eukprot:CAMPEP_0201579860 /NCGR_PEP_ID=MMETSP0190_2-20130828/27748_1 /ASSEMBLY_ACC=CAM_ASM_000263 /TAXON_ID=37353 /ORGANISM="Rosalina sp." /LENGTH=385 /DNA_ID=CAMNT_0048014899 /DNA_START=183 /DNA_END=1343 /DNA_ORIENTATION=+
MAKAIFQYFSKQSTGDPSISSMDDLKFEDAAPIIRKTWGELMKDKVSVGAKIYDYILTKEISMSRLFMQTNIEQQSGIFMIMMDKVVGFLDDPASMDDNLVKLGELHVQKYGVKTKHFKHFRAAFLKAIKKYLPWTDRREAAWQWFWTRIITQMSHATQANHYPLVNKFDGKELTREQMIEFAHYIHDTFDTALTIDPKGFAENFYKNLLNEQPDIAQLFKKKNTTFEKQSTRFIAMLSHAIKLLDDTDTFTQKLESLSAQHVEYGVQIPMLQSFGTVLIGQVKELNIKYYNQQQSGSSNNNQSNQPNKNKTSADDEKDSDGDINLLKISKWESKQDDAWNWFWKIVVGVMSSGMQNIIKERQNQANKPQVYNKDAIASQDFSAI